MEGDAMQGSVRVLFFALLREKIGAKELWVAIEEGVRARDLLLCLQDVYPQVRDFLPRVRVAVNQRITAMDAILADGDEIALIPPVSGG